MSISKLLQNDCPSYTSCMGTVHDKGKFFTLLDPFIHYPTHQHETKHDHRCYNPVVVLFLLLSLCYPPFWCPRNRYARGEDTYGRDK